ncbi:MAG: YigZ family protein [Clostridia bacterium]|nr:YigZ family protein [Clostridia bacterium]
MNPYKTLLKAGEDQFIVNKSRFIGHAAPVTTVEEALGFLEKTRNEHRDANHNCFAYILGVNKGIMRYSDDGEPSGTAGLPIIEVMKARDVTDCAVVVTRYFGGILLGAGGLVRAYAQGAKIALDAAGVGTMHPTSRYMIDMSYPLLGKIEHFLKDKPAIVEDKTFTDTVTMTLIVRQIDERELIDGLASASDGRIEAIRLEEIYLPWAE